MLAFKHVENFRSPLRIGTVVKGNREVVLTGAIARDTIRLGQTLEGLAVNESSLLVDGQLALAITRLRLDMENFAETLHVNILTGRNVFQPVRRVGFTGHIPAPPQGAVFRAQPPEGEGLDARSEERRVGKE